VRTYPRALAVIGSQLTWDGDDDFGNALAPAIHWLEHVLARGDLGEDDEDGDLLAHAVALLVALVERRERRKAEAIRYAIRARGIDFDCKPCWLGKHPHKG
jgi:hypothetical protein